MNMDFGRACGRVGICAALLVLAGCGKNVLDFRNAEVSNGKIYADRANEPFSGKVTNIPEERIVPRKINSELLGPLQTVLKNAGGYVAYFIPNSTCDADVRQGAPIGNLVCKNPSSQVRYEMSFSDGTLDGEIKVYATGPTNHLVASGTYKAGRLDGKHEIFSPVDGKKLWEASWKAGALDGPETMWHLSTGNLAYSATYKDGKPEGPVVKYAEDGKRVLYRANFVGGLFEGVQEEFFESGKPAKYVEWKAGRKHGISREWNGIDEQPFESQCVEGNCVVTKRHDDVPVEDKAAAPKPSAYAACMDKWTEVHRKLLGEGAAVSEEQLKEWRAMCVMGRTPA